MHSVAEDAKAGQVPVDRAPGRIGFMSTQRRENRAAHRSKLIAWASGMLVEAVWSAGVSIPAARTRQRTRQRYNGPAHVDHLVDMGLVAHLRRRSQAPTFGWPQTLCYSDHCIGNTLLARIALQVRRPRLGQADRRLSVHAGYAQVIPSAHPPPPRPHASPSILAAGPSRRSPLGGKARWQKRFVFPARRMRRGLQF